MADIIHVIKCAGPPTNPPTHEGQHWVDSSTGDLYFSNGTASVANWILVGGSGAQVLEVTVSASSTSNLLVTPLANFCSQEFSICMFNVTEDKWRSLKLYGSKSTSTTVTDSVFAVLGQILDVDLSFIVSGSNGILEAINNESFDVTIRFRVETI